MMVTLFTLGKIWLGCFALLMLLVFILHMLNKFDD